VFKLFEDVFSGSGTGDVTGIQKFFFKEFFLTVEESVWLLVNPGTQLIARHNHPL